MFVTFKMVFVYVTLGTLAGIIGIPYSLLVGNIKLLYRVVVRGIVPLGVWDGRNSRGGDGPGACAGGGELHLPVQPCVEPGPAGAAAGAAGPVFGAAEEGADADSAAGDGDAAGQICSSGAGRRREAAQASIAAAEAALRSGLHVLFFAEGTRSEDGRLLTFKSGPFYLAMGTGAPIVPIAISGTEKMMRKHSAKVTPGVAKVQILKSIDPAEYATRDELMRAARAAMVAALPEEMRPLS